MSTEPSPQRQDRPLIGITTSELRRPPEIGSLRHSEPAQTDILLGLAYPQAVLAAGGIPVILTPVPETEITELLRRIDGLVLSGGPDLHPSAYGQEPHLLLGPTERELDSFELSLCEAAWAARLPTLGICRGLQVINVVAGGTLHQHLPDRVGERIAHRQTQPDCYPTHTVEIMPGSRTAALIGDARLRVNSFHHQAIDLLGSWLRVEGSGEGWLFGVQWHAEGLIGQPRQLALFESLVAAARANSWPSSARWLAPPTGVWPGPDRAALRAEVARLAADPADAAERRAVMADMAALAGDAS